jgi:localization factor PodJL
MNARPSWNLDDINPKVRERAEDSARRAGMTVGDWLNATIGDAAAGSGAGLGKSPFDTREPQPPREKMSAHERLDAISKQFDSGVRTPKPDAAVTSDAPSRADARLAHYAESSAAARKASDPYGPRSSGAISLEAAIAEISARQQELAAPSSDARTTVQTSKLSTLERQISHIMTQMESLPNPGLIEQSIESFRSDLADIRKTITEAMPRRAIESIESEVRTLSQRIDESRERGADATALAGVEKGLDQIRESLKTLMPAEQLAGFDEAIRNLASQLDSVVRGGNDATVLNELEEAIASLRVIVSKVASNEALSSLGGDVRSLASKLDEFANSGGFGESLAALETRIVSLASFLQKRDRAEGGAGGSEKVETALRALSERIDHLPASSDMPSGYDARMSNLLDRLEAISNNPSLNRVEEGLDDIRRQLDERRSLLATTEDMPSRVLDPSLVDSVKRELADIRLSLTFSERHTLESLEVVNNTLGHVVDRLAMIEGDLRGQTVQPKMPQSPLAAAAAAIAQNAAMSRPEMPNPAAYHRPLHETMEAPPLQPRAPIAPELPPDTPLEPGTRASSRVSDEGEVYADEAPQDSTSTSSFIAAARRAARAAAAAAPQNEKGKKAPAKPGEPGESSIASKIRSLLVGASVVVIVVGSFRMAMALLDGVTPPVPDMPASLTSSPAGSSSTAPAPAKQSALMAPAPTADPFVNVATQASASGDVTGSINVQGTAEASKLSEPPMPFARANVPAGEILPDSIGTQRLRDAALKGDAGAAFEIGARYAEARGVAANFPEAAKWYDRAAQAGIAPAAFRLGAMYEKGVGVKKDLEAARRYYSQAADRGNAKAMHNLAVLDADGGGNGANFKSASMWFRKAAERGVVDSQYNLGILYARGIGVEQNLGESFKWFSLAASQGDADSAAKRDDVAKKIDPQSLAAAKLAIQTFTPEAQPAEATSLGVPAGGWDSTAQQTANAKPAGPARKAAPR